MRDRPLETGGLPLGVGLVGTGFAAKLRSEALQTDSRSRLVAVAGHQFETTLAFARTHGAIAIPSWQELVERPDIDLVLVCTINCDHGAIARAALEQNKHVVVEYPLSLDPAEAETCIQLARQRGKLLHVEHIELLGGWHQTLKQHLPHLEPVTFLRYATVTPQNPAPCKWTYHRELFGFPLSGALSRLHRLTDALGSVATVSCQQRYWEAPEPGYYRACLVTAQVQFANGAIAEVVYGKGETLWHPLRTMEVHGERGTLLFEGDRATLIQGETQTPLDMDGRRGLFAKDMQMAIDHLVEGKPLYVQPEASLYALRVADAARRSAEMEGAICVP